MSRQQADTLRTVIKKWGEQRLGADCGRRQASCRLELDETVDVREESGRIVIEPVERKE